MRTLHVAEVRVAHPRPRIRRRIGGLNLTTRLAISACPALTANPGLAASTAPPTATSAVATAARLVASTGAAVRAPLVPAAPRPCGETATAASLGSGTPGRPRIASRYTLATLATRAALAPGISALTTVTSARAAPAASYPRSTG